MRISKQAVLAAPGIVLSALPVGACPACWPVYASILSALGATFLLSSAYLLPLTAVFLVITVVTLGFRASARRGYGPLALGIAASGGVLIGKFSLASQLVTYAGTALLVFSALWNAWPRRVAAAHCPKCAPSESELIQLSATEKSSI
jgi:hypothetical protein